MCPETGLALYPGQCSRLPGEVQGAGLPRARKRKRQGLEAPWHTPTARRLLARERLETTRKQHARREPVQTDGTAPPAAGHRRLRPSPPSQTRGQVASQVSAPLDSFTPRHAQQPEARAVSGRSAFGQNARETVQQTGNDSRGKRVKGSKHLGTRQQPDACLRVSGTRQPASSMERSSESPRLLSIIGPVCGAEMFDFLQ